MCCDAYFKFKCELYLDDQKKMPKMQSIAYLRPKTQ